MTNTTATIATEKGARYITQLCKHWSHRFDVTFDDTQGRVELPGGPVLLEAGASALKITIQPKSPEAREKMQQVVAEHLDRFAFREAPLTYNWS